MLSASNNSFTSFILSQSCIHLSGKLTPDTSCTQTHRTMPNKTKRSSVVFNSQQPQQYRFISGRSKTMYPLKYFRAAKERNRIKAERITDRFNRHISDSEMITHACLLALEAHLDVIRVGMPCDSLQRNGQ